MAAIWNLTTPRLYYRQFWVIWDKNGSSLKSYHYKVILHTNWVIWDKNGSSLKSYHYKVILQTELSHLGQNWQRFEISPLQGYIADGIELLGTKMAAVIWQKKTAFWMGTLSNLYISMLFCSQNPARAHFQISVLQGYFADRIWNLGRKWAHLQILVLKGFLQSESII